MNALGYFITGVGQQQYFAVLGDHIRDSEHLQAYVKASELVISSDGGLVAYYSETVSIRPVYRHIDCPWYVIVQDIIEGLGVFYTRWTPESPIPIEQDHFGRHRLSVVDFAFTVEDAVHIVKRHQSKGD